MNDIVFTMVAFLTMISAIVVIHEFGHYSAARLFGLVATKFSLGFGSKVLSWTDGKGTQWKVSPILLGGYVSFPGDDPKTPLEPGQKRLNDLPRWQRAIVVGAGPGINFVLAGLLFSAIAGFYGYPVGRPILDEVVAGTPAARAGLMAGDLITTIDGNRIVSSNDVTKNTVLQPGVTKQFGYTRNGRDAVVPVTIGSKRIVDEDGNNSEMGFIGVRLNHEMRRASNPFEAVTQGVSDGIFMTWVQYESLKQIVTGRRSVTEMSGPVRIAKMSAKTMSMGLMPFLYLMAMISISVGVFNLLPIPGLDGGHLMTYAVEGAMGRDIPEQVLNRVVRIGFSIVASIGIFAIMMDIIALT